MRLANILIVLYKIFFVGLLLQFFLFNVMTYGLDLWLPNRVWLWKEGIIGVLLIGSLIRTCFHKGRRTFLFPHSFTYVQWALFALAGLMMWIDLGVYQQSVGTLFTAIKYDILGFIIFFVALHSSAVLDATQKQHLLRWYLKGIKYLLLLAIIWYLLILIKPGTLKLFGYDNFIFEWVVGTNPPAVYYNHINQGIVRNQFLFERPISWGFFLTAFWPLFFFMCLYKQPLRYTWVWWSLYMLNVFLTFSRAARGAIIIQCVLIGLLIYRHQKRKFFMTMIVPGIFAVLALLYGGMTGLLQRGFSDKGHLAMLTQSREMIQASPWIGLWGTSVGPGSHHGWTAFNPENQFLQIWLEYGIGGMLLRLCIFVGLIVIGRNLWKKDRFVFVSDSHTAWIGLCLWLVGLGISGLVLHSFSDRMIVYPFMLMGWILASLTFHQTKTWKTSKSN